MSFGYLAGITTAGAADEIVDWFATFEAWIVGLGWTVEAGGGTTNLVLRSIGEAAPPPLTMLWLRVWRDPGNPNRVRIEVRDDLAGTHETNEAGYLDGEGAQFPFWMSGDMDAIDMCFRGGALYHSIYAGLVVPFALTVPDETYRMIATSTQEFGSILRDSTGVWDVDHNMYGFRTTTGIYQAGIDMYDGSYPLGGVYFDRQANIAGQLKHRSYRILDPAINVMDTLETGRPGATTTWIVIEDRNHRRYAIRTGGVLPTGPADPGTFTAVAGVAGGINALWAALSTHLTGLGWTDLGDPGLPGMVSGRLYSSPGESGQDEIYIGYAQQTAAAPDRLYYYVQNDGAGTYRFPTTSHLNLDALDFPISYWICGDRDCCILVIDRPPGYGMIWSGLIPAFAPGLLPPYTGPPLTVYQLYAGKQGQSVGLNIEGGLLRWHDGRWQPFPGVSDFTNDGPAQANNSNPNNFDGTTYLLWPQVVHHAIGPWNGYVRLGELRYVGYSSGGGIANLDTITIGAEVYTVFFDNIANNFCVRTV